MKNILRFCFFAGWRDFLNTFGVLFFFSFVFLWQAEHGKQSLGAILFSSLGVNLALMIVAGYFSFLNRFVKNLNWMSQLPIRKSTLLWVPAALALISILVGSALLLIYGGAWWLLTPPTSPSAALSHGPASPKALLPIVFYGMYAIAVSWIILSIGHRDRILWPNALGSRPPFNHPWALPLLLFVGVWFFWDRFPPCLLLPALFLACVVLTGTSAQGLRTSLTQERRWVRMSALIIIVPSLLGLAIPFGSAHSKTSAIKAWGISQIAPMTFGLTEEDFRLAVAAVRDEDEILSLGNEYKRKFGSSLKVNLHDSPEIDYLKPLQYLKWSGFRREYARLLRVSTMTLQDLELFLKGQEFKPGQEEHLYFMGFEWKPGDTVKMLNSASPKVAHLGIFVARVHREPQALETLLQKIDGYPATWKAATLTTLSVLAGRKITPDELASPSRRAGITFFSTTPDCAELRQRLAANLLDTQDTATLNICLWASPRISKVPREIGWLDLPSSLESRVNTLEWLESPSTGP